MANKRPITIFYHKSVVIQGDKLASALGHAVKVDNAIIAATRRLISHDSPYVYAVICDHAGKKRAKLESDRVRGGICELVVVHEEGSF